MLLDDEFRDAHSYDKFSFAASIQVSKRGENLENKRGYDGQPGDRTASGMCCVSQFSTVNADFGLSGIVP